MANDNQPTAGGKKGVPALPKEPSHQKPKQSVSAASIFAAKHRSDHLGKTTPSTRSPLKPRLDSKIKKREAAQHPLAIAFKETTDDYRRQLYTEAVTKINEKHDRLVEKLHSTTPNDAIPNPNDPTDPRLALAKRLELETEVLCKPIGNMKPITRTFIKNGKKVNITRDLGERINDFQLYVERSEKVILKLQEEWKQVVAQIWECGVHVLGFGPMFDLFVPDHGYVMCPPPENGEGEDIRGSAALDWLPNFLHEPSMSASMRQRLPAAHHVKAIKDLQKRINQLGVAQIKDLQRLDEEREKWLDTKIQQLVAVWKEDE